MRPPRASLAWALLLGACVIGRRPVVAPDGEDAVVLVASGGFSGAFGEAAVHSWIAVRPAGDSRWERWEVIGSEGRGDGDGYWGWVERSRPEDPLRWFERRTVHVHGVIHGRRAERLIECLRREGPRYEHRYVYRFWPGPNCNTFVDTMLRRCGFGVDLPVSAFGKDFRGVAGASFTSGGTGVQVESPVLGVRLGLTEGIAVHLFTLTFGVDLWPPALLVPLGPGRIGFDDR